MALSNDELQAFFKIGVGGNVQHKDNDYKDYPGTDKKKNTSFNKKGNKNNWKEKGNKNDWKKTGGDKKSKKDKEPKISKEFATAPYNFISLPTRALPSKLGEHISDFKADIEAGYKDYLNADETISGYIDLKMETLTPLFIRNEKGEPFKLGDIPVLPGSSLRGMFKNIFKIITMGTLRSNEDYYDRHIFYRRIMATDKDYLWAHDLYELYVNRLKSSEGSKVRPGFLVMIKDDYYIVPAKDGRDTIKKFMTDILEKRKVSNIRASDVFWDKTWAYIWTGTLGIDKFSKNPKYDLFDTVEEYNAAKAKYNEEHEADGDNYEPFNMGKQLIRYIKLEDARWNEKCPVDIKEYMMDNNRGGVNLLATDSIMKKISKLNVKVDIPKGISRLAPCYYVPEGGDIELFGHGRCFRIPYDHSIGEIVKKQLEEKVIDYSDAVFGMSPYFASRVFFEDARPEREVKLMTEFNAHPLLQPNPTSFQLYLKNEKGKKLANWDSENAEIRGYKLYWHQANHQANVKKYYEASYKEQKRDDDQEDEKKKLCLPMRPIPAHTNFTSRIRFKNLHPDELGALIMTLDINHEDKNIAFKLGQGKSIGLGSIKLNRHDLYVETKEAYTSFLAGNNMANVCQPVEASGYKKNFEEAIPADLQSEWTNIMEELTDMLDYDNTRLPGWEKGTSLMRSEDPKSDISEGFKERRALPVVSKVLELAQN